MVKVHILRFVSCASCPRRHTAKRCQSRMDRISLRPCRRTSPASDGSAWLHRQEARREQHDSPILRGCGERKRSGVKFDVCEKKGAQRVCVKPVPSRKGWDGMNPGGRSRIETVNVALKTLLVATVENTQSVTLTHSHASLETAALDMLVSRASHFALRHDVFVVPPSSGVAGACVLTVQRHPL